MATLTQGEPIINIAGESGGSQVMVSFDGMTLDNSTKAVTINPNAVTGADLQVTNLTSLATAIGLFVDVSIGAVGIGTNSPNISGSGAERAALTILDDDQGLLEIATNKAISEGDPTSILGFINSNVTGNAGQVAQIRTEIDGASATNPGGAFIIRVKPNNTTMPLHTLKIDHEENTVIGRNEPDPGGIGINKYLTLQNDSAGATYEMASARADADGQFIGGFITTWTTITSGTKRITGINFQSDGTTALNRGGEILFKTKIDGGTAFNTQVTIDNAGVVILNVLGLVGGDFRWNLSGGNAGILADASAKTVSISPGTKFDGRVFEESGEVQTTDATVTTVKAVTLLDENVYLVTAKVVGVKSDGTDRAVYIRRCAVFRTGAGSATLQGAVDGTFERESNASWDVTLDVNANTVRVRVTGVVATTIEWGCQIELENISN